MTDKNQSIFWFGLNIVKQENSEPGPEEIRGKQPDYYWPRDRHVRLETDRLQELFDKIALVEGDVQKYAKLAAWSGHYLNDDGTTPTDWVDQELHEEAQRKKEDAENNDGMEGTLPIDDDAVSNTST